MNHAQADTFKGDILVVDDIPNNLRFLATMLTEQGYEVRKVLNGQMALIAARAAPPDLILLDIMMPEMNGYEVCQHLKADQQTREVPIIFISILDEVMDKVKAFSLGGVDYITKPFHLEEVLVRIENQLTLRRLQKQLQEQNARLQQEICERQKAEAALKSANLELQRFVNLDGLTGINNRRRFDEYLDQEWRRMTRERSPLSLVLCDVDCFKLYNDTYGHIKGDHCLKQVAQAISDTLKRPADLVARYGGEEFVVILPKTNAEGATKVAQTILLQIQQLQIPHASSYVSNYVSLSIGVASIIPTQKDSSETLVALADKALYQAKQQGRDCIILKRV